MTLCVDKSVYVTKNVSKLMAYVCMLYYDFKLIILYLLVFGKYFYNQSYLENLTTFIALLY